MATAADDTADLAARLLRIKALCERLLAERANGAEVRIIAERIGAEHARRTQVAQALAFPLFLDGADALLRGVRGLLGALSPLLRVSGPLRRLRLLPGGVRRARSSPCLIRVRRHHLRSYRRSSSTFARGAPNTQCHATASDWA